MYCTYMVLNGHDVWVAVNTQVGSVKLFYVQGRSLNFFVCWGTKNSEDPMSREQMRCKLRTEQHVRSCKSWKKKAFLSRLMAWLVCTDNSSWRQGLRRTACIARYKNSKYCYKTSGIFDWLTTLCLYISVRLELQISCTCHVFILLYLVKEKVHLLDSKKKKKVIHVHLNVCVFPNIVCHVYKLFL